jgi:aminoglycoside/choline kinase family phosphotransferase
MQIKIERQIKRTFEQWKHCEPDRVSLLPESGSNRKYYRITQGGKSVIAAYNTDIAENIAYLDYSEQLKAKNIPIPKTLYVSQDKEIYFVEDLGDTTLFSLIEKEKSATNNSAANITRYTPGEPIKTLYRQAIKDLQKIQIEGGKNFDYTHSFPTQKFDRQSMLWDLNYFKYMFLRLSGTPFNEQKLENDFTTLVQSLTNNVPNDYFLYRDFQTRNIMVTDGTLRYIDFQGGRQGALQYDLASLLYNAQANLSESFRAEMLDFYCRQLQENYPQEAAKQTDFKQTFYTFAILRILQAVGGYGYRGLHQHKQLFKDSIPYAMRNLTDILEQRPVNIPEIRRIVDSYREKVCAKRTDSLTLTIQSFSYRNPLPADPNGNGGGFIFDCRYLPNPGREQEYRQLTGKDNLVINYLRAISEVERFIERAVETVLPAVEAYQDRDFANLQINFGCTGGQHRSVYCAEAFAEKISARTSANIIINHLNITLT